MSTPGGDQRSSRDWQCVCGRYFARRGGRSVHQRSCPIEAARSAAYVAAIVAGKSPWERGVMEADAITAALAERGAK